MTNNSQSEGKDFIEGCTCDSCKGVDIEGGDIVLKPGDSRLITWKERFDEKFLVLKFGDGSPNGGGKGTYLTIKENLSMDEIKSFISQEITAAEQRGYQRGLREKEQCPYSDCWKVKYRECPIHGVKPK